MAENNCTKGDVCPRCLSYKPFWVRVFPKIFMCEICAGEGRVRAEIAAAYDRREIARWRAQQP